MRTVPILSLIFASALSAQYVSPVEATNAEGLSNNIFPFGGTAVPFRFVQVHDDTPAGVISSLAFRHNMASVTYAAHSITCDIWASTALTTSAAVNATFDLNHGANKFQVVTNRTFNHPASDPNCGPGAFLLQYPFDTPFAFPGGGSFCWETQVTAKTQTSSIPHDAVTPNSLNPSLQVGRFGVGCLATGRTVAMGATGTSTAMNWAGGAGTLRVTGTNAPASAPLVLVLGTSKTNWLGLPLPFELPGTNTAPSGSCFVYTDILASFPNAASATGTSTNDVPVPLAPHMNGLTTRTQIVAIDASANLWSVVTSPVVLHNFAAPTAPNVCARVFLSASLGPVGTVGVTSWLVTRFN